MAIQIGRASYSISVGMVMTSHAHVVSVRHLRDASVLIRLATWCHQNLEFNTWTWGGGEFRFQKHDDAVQFALLLD
jgi:hypothetical protein